jgi:hypothetical protein
MEILIGLTILAVIVRVVIFFCAPELDETLSGFNSSDNKFFSNNSYDEEIPPYHNTIGGYSSGGSSFNNSSNNYGLSSKE